MKRLILFMLLLIVSCTQSPYPGIDRPNNGGNSAEDSSIIDYIDQRLEAEYYWLDEVAKRCNTFNRQQVWENYLGSVLGSLQTNVDDGYVNGKGQRVFYSYIREVESSTRGMVTGFGIELHYTIIVINMELGHYGFVVENIFAGSPAETQGIKRGDIITMIDGVNITPGNYASRFESINSNRAASLRLMISRQTTKESFEVELQRASYAASPVAHAEVIEIEGYDRKIGYLVYTGFESEYDDELLASVEELCSAGIGEMILDLRCNTGGSVLSAVKLCSALVPSQYEGGVLCRVQRNPKNTKSDVVQEFKLENTSEHFANLERLTVICSDYSASASELVIMGLRGLDFPVTLIGSTTEGKNCGMDVTRRTIGNTTVEYAPITFMCFDAKGFGGWGEGIVPDVDLTKGDNSIGVSDEHYPLPRAEWGDARYDIALAAALASVTGRGVTTGPEPSLLSSEELLTIDLNHPVKGIRYYAE